MNERSLPSLTKWPFFAADIVLVLLAFWILNHYPHPLPLWPAILMIGCVISATFVGLLPFRLEYETAVKFAEASELTTAAKEIENLQSVADQIRSATGQWQTVQEHCAASVAMAKSITDTMGSEAKAFADFMRKANDSEKATIRLEIEKLRRGEGQWLQLIVHMLDHVFALYQAGTRSGQPNLEAQLGNFQEACRDLVRRVGLTPFEAAANESFDPNKHQVVDGQAQPGPDSPIGQMLAVGYTFQGQILRRSVVTVQADGADAANSTIEQSVGEEIPSATDAPVEELTPEVALVEPTPAPEETVAEQEFRLQAEELRDVGQKIRPNRA
jgi:molecular chaperone GrpE (heat shock protein)